MSAASPEILEKGGDSVIHSSISIANEYVSEYVVTGERSCLMSSGAVYLRFVSPTSKSGSFVSGLPKAASQSW